jgi:hypothetical protein
MLSQAASGIFARLLLFFSLPQFIIVLNRLLNRIGIYRQRIKSANLRVFDRRFHAANNNVALERTMASHAS